MCKKVEDVRLESENILDVNSNMTHESIELLNGEPYRVIRYANKGKYSSHISIFDKGKAHS